MNVDYTPKIYKIIKNKTNKIKLRESITFGHKNNVIINTIHISETLSKMGFYKDSTYRSLSFTFFWNGILYQNIPRGDVQNILIKILKKDNTLKPYISEVNTNLHNYLVRNTTIITNLEYFNLPKYIDDPNSIRFFFKSNIIRLFRSNNVIESTEETYSEFRNQNKYILSKNIIDFDYSINKKEEQSILKDLFHKITNDENHFQSLISFIGFSISSHKSLKEKTIFIISDEKSQIHNESHGQSCKSFLINALSKIRKIDSENGRDFNKNFPFQMVEKSTELLVFGDVNKDFPLPIFYELKDGMHIEYKGIGKIKIAFTESPKVIITTNYNLGSDNSTDRGRIYRMTINNFFNDQNTPFDTFNQEFFTDWNNKEWHSFYSFMIECAKFYLLNGLIEYTNKKLSYRKLTNQTSKKFIKEVDSLELKKWYILKELTTKIFNNGQRASAIALSKETIKYLELYCNYNKLKLTKMNKSQNKTHFKLEKLM